ncbi:MAG: hypothetical protein K8F59_06150 [Rhodobacteraceae bacterium]|nr:hypothetical protein [Paracoccaceae bacterium]
MRPFALMLCLLLLPAPLLADTSDKAVFAITANGFRFGDMALDYAEAGGRYRFGVASQATGIFGFLTRSQYAGWSEGQIGEGGRLIPSAFAATSERIFKNREVRVSFAPDGKPLSVDISPARDRTDLSDPASVPAGRIDSLSYLAMLFRPPDNSCPEPRDLYDGRRMTRIELRAEPGATGRLICAGTYRITAGPDHSLRRGFRSFSVKLDYRRTDEGLWLDRAWFTSADNVVELSR